jgi:hypothetical protein
MRRCRTNSEGPTRIYCLLIGSPEEFVPLWEEEQAPPKNYIWVDNGHISVCPPIDDERLSGAHFRHISEHPSESFLGPRAVPIVVSDSDEPEPDSDIPVQPPADYEDPSLFKSKATS